MYICINLSYPEAFTKFPGTLNTREWLSFVMCEVMRWCLWPKQKVPHVRKLVGPPIPVNPNVKIPYAAFEPVRFHIQYLGTVPLSMLKATWNCIVMPTFSGDQDGQILVEGLRLAFIHLANMWDTKAQTFIDLLTATTAMGIHFCIWQCCLENIHHQWVKKNNQVCIHYNIFMPTIWQMAGNTAVIRYIGIIITVRKAQ